MTIEELLKKLIKTHPDWSYEELATEVRRLRPLAKTNSKNVAWYVCKWKNNFEIKEKSNSAINLSKVIDDYGAKSSTEKKAMDLVIEDLRKEGFEVYNSEKGENGTHRCGYDLTARRKVGKTAETRHIEVKGRVNRGYVELTPNEYQKMTGDALYWLYFVRLDRLGGASIYKLNQTALLDETRSTKFTVLRITRFKGL